MSCTVSRVKKVTVALMLFSLTIKVSNIGSTFVVINVHRSFLAIRLSTRGVVISTLWESDFT